MTHGIITQLGRTKLEYITQGNIYKSKITQE